MPAPIDSAARVLLPLPRAGTSTLAVPDAAFAAWALAEPDCLVVATGACLTVAWANHATAGIFGCDERELLGRSLLGALACPSTGERLEREELVDVHRAVVRDVVVTRCDGQQLRSVLRSFPVGEGWVVRLAADASAAGVADDLHLSRERFQAVSDRAPVGICSSEAGLRLAYVNDAFAEVFGVQPDVLLGTRWLLQLHPADQVVVGDAVVAVLAGTACDLAARVLRPSGEVRSVQLRLVPVRTERRAAGFVGTLEDVTERLSYEQTLAYQASHDPLTGMLNRRGLLQALSVSMARASLPSKPAGTAVLFLDLDDFKVVNDSLGHEAGDHLLIEVARRLSASVRAGDVVSRFGGDEFAVLCQGIRDDEHASEVAARVLEAATRTVEVAGTVVSVSGSLGVVLLSADHLEAEDVLRDADAAMYQAKAAGKDRFVLFDEAARERYRRRHQLVMDLRVALERGDLHVAYQPVVRLASPVSGAPYAVEALVRWDHPVRGMVSPQEFVALAEENGLIAALSAQVLRAACRQTAEWQQAYGSLAPSRVCVNVSPLQLRHVNFVQEVAGVLRETGLPGSSLTLELTESAVMEDPTIAAASFAALRELGVRVAIDDFGTGYSSLALLRTLPVDLLKVDRSFLAEIEEEGAARVVAAVVGLGEALGLEVVAEGVETADQVAELERLGCPMAQGYLFSRPLSVHQLQERMEKGWPW